MEMRTAERQRGRARRTTALAAALAAGAFLAAGCGGASQDDVDALEARMAQLEGQVDALERETEALEPLAERIQQIQGALDEIRDRIPDLDELQDLLERLGGLVGGALP